jgi:hypothetical protein
MQGFWKNSGLESVEMRVTGIPTVYSDFDDFWESNVLPISPQGKIIASMAASAREELRSPLRDHLPISPGWPHQSDKVELYPALELEMVLTGFFDYIGRPSCPHCVAGV